MAANEVLTVKKSAGSSIFLTVALWRGTANRQKSPEGSGSQVVILVPTEALGGPQSNHYLLTTIACGIITFAQAQKYLATISALTRDEGARHYLETFLRKHQPTAGTLPEDREASAAEITRALTPAGRPSWTEADWEKLYQSLGYAGYCWLRPEGVLEQLSLMSREWGVGSGEQGAGSESDELETPSLFSQAELEPESDSGHEKEALPLSSQAELEPESDSGHKQALALGSQGEQEKESKQLTYELEIEKAREEIIKHKVVKAVGHLRAGRKEGDKSQKRATFPAWAAFYRCLQRQGFQESWEFGSIRAEGVNTVSISEDNRYILSESKDGRVKRWELAGGSCLDSLEEHEDEVLSVSLNGESTQVLSGSADKTLKLWDWESKACLRTYKGHEGEVSSCCFSPDGRYILSSSFDKTLKLWEVERGECLHTFEGHEEQRLSAPKLTHLSYLGEISVG